MIKSILVYDITNFIKDKKVLSPVTELICSANNNTISLTKSVVI